MQSVHFDTLEAAKILDAAGITKPHAEAMVKTIQSALGDALGDHVATKADIAEVQAEMRLMEHRLTIKLASIMGGMAVLLFAALRYL